MNCCDYGCTRAPNCPAGSVVATKLLAGETLPELVPYEFAPGWFCFNEPDLEDEDDESILTPGRVMVGCGVFLAMCVAMGVVVLKYFR